MINKLIPVVLSFLAVACATRADIQDLAREMTRARNCEEVQKYAQSELASAEASYSNAKRTASPDDIYVAHRKIATAIAASRLNQAETKYKDMKKLYDEKLAKDALLKSEEEKKRMAELAEQQRLLKEKEAQLAKAQSELEEAMRGIGEVKMEERGLVVYVSDILFDTAKSDIKESVADNLSKVSEVLGRYEQYNLKVEGHTDSVGTDEYNMKLSIARAKSVANFLSLHGIASERISTEGFGESKPIATNSTADGRQRNRRVEIVVGSDR